MNVFNFDETKSRERNIPHLRILDSSWMNRVNSWGIDDLKMQEIRRLYKKPGRWLNFHALFPKTTL